jgi:hypothetical protein
LSSKARRQSLNEEAKQEQKQNSELADQDLISQKTQREFGC